MVRIRVILLSLLLSAFVSQMGSRAVASISPAPSTNDANLAQSLLRSASQSLQASQRRPVGFIGPLHNEIVESIGKRCCAAMAFNPTLGTLGGQIMLYGGDDGATVFSDTWVWDGTSWTLFPTTGQPGPRRSTRMVWDAALGAMVMFGGSNTLTDPGALSDTWLFSSGDWHPCQAGCGTPGSLTSPGLAYDAANSLVVEFGGQAVNGIPQQGTWTFDGTWHHQNPSKSPIALGSPGMTYHSGRSKVILFGGKCVSGSGCDANGYYGETWQWNWSGGSGNWQHLMISNPPARTGHRMEYDTSASRMIMFGGWTVTPTNLLNDTWGLATTGGWGLCAPINGNCTTTPPKARCCVGLAYDSSTDATGGKLVLFGGGTLDGAFAGSYFDDTWTWDGMNWSCVSGGLGGCQT